MPKRTAGVLGLLTACLVHTGCGADNSCAVDRCMRPILLLSVEDFLTGDRLPGATVKVRAGSEDGDEEAVRQEVCGSVAFPDCTHEIMQSLQQRQDASEEGFGQFIPNGTLGFWVEASFPGYKTGTSDVTAPIDECGKPITQSIKIRLVAEGEVEQSVVIETPLEKMCVEQ